MRILNLNPQVLFTKKKKENIPLHTSRSNSNSVSLKLDAKNTLLPKHIWYSPYLLFALSFLLSFTPPLTLFPQYLIRLFQQG